MRVRESMNVPNHAMSRTAGSAFGSTARAGVIAAFSAVGYLERSPIGLAANAGAPEVFRLSA
jgi:hypothetical protein